MAKTKPQLDPQEVAVSIGKNLQNRNYSTAINWLKKLPQDVCLETLAVACDSVEPQVAARLLEYLGFDPTTQYDVFSMLGADKPFKETPTFYGL